MLGISIPAFWKRLKKSPFRPASRSQASAPMNVGRIRGSVASVLMTFFPGISYRDRKKAKGTPMSMESAVARTLTKRLFLRQRR